MCLLGSMSLGAVAVAMLLLLPSAFLKKGQGMAYGIIVTVIIGLICLADIFCQEYFFSTLSAGLVRLVRNTDAGEVSNFCGAFLKPSIFGRWRITACLILILGTPFAALIKLPKLPLWVMLVAAVIGLWHMGNTPPGRLATSIVEIIKQDRKTEKQHKAFLTAKADTCTFLSPRIVLVIGESFNKHHASAYGYRLPTTPFLDAHVSDGSVTLFADAVTPWNMTADVFESMFSVPFPAILKRAGYKVNFYSNQNPAGLGFKVAARGQFLFNDRVISDACFSYKNTRTRLYDHDFIEDVLPDTLTIAPVLDIIHLKGQHFDYEKHYPQSFARFTQADYPDGTPLEVMHYDNATNYHDYVLERILQYYSATDAIVVFLADHGEEVFDDLPISGRSHEVPGPAEAKAEFEVPMWIWCSSEYALSHPDVVGLLPAAAVRPFYTADISHLILALAGAAGEFTSPEHNVLSDSYCCPARILAGSVDYDTL